MRRDSRAGLPSLWRTSWHPLHWQQRWVLLWVSRSGSFIRALRATMIFPGEFVPRRASKFEDGLLTYAPQLFVLFLFGLFAPGGLFEYALFKGHLIVGVIGLFLWVPLLWAFLVIIHNDGRIRFWVSAPIVLIGHVLIALHFAGRL